MKKCPTCRRSFDDSITYCLDDGTPLVSEASPDSEATLVNPSPAQSAGSNELPQYTQMPGKATVSASQLNVPVMPSYRATPQTRRVWPWVVAGLAVFFLFAIMIIAAIVIPQIAKKSRNSNRPVVEEPPTPLPSDTSTPAPKESTSDTEAPTDEDVVLAQLTDLEKQWTQANIDGDKNALDRILAAEYSGGNPPHTRQQYIDELKPDATVKSWDFQDLRVDLDGERATIDGYLRQETTRGTEVYSFTDEFVWRDGRWQATGSRTVRVK